MAKDDTDERNACDFCKQGKVVCRREELRFRRTTDRGVIHCRVTIPVKKCESCGFTHLDAAADTLIEDAARRAYEQLRPE
ncbi:hypothetical protein [Limobrevibacterium gyesilva]|uniref:YgiT-type zinc finger protein n=1 Tax=Limobrevibacterium gyesilva TaxID=2991712 RepID=A0AA41YKB5_9PROT|nr:hypothetical protein [Limobrevibacterium gyesilva]MCW3474864.1 hypothetical protein [Limobrevibacterium gyesilva]